MIKYLTAFSDELTEVNTLQNEMFEESPGKSRSIFKTQASIYDEAILRKKLMTFYFPKKSPS